jgi:hypothetical protein
MCLRNFKKREGTCNLGRAHEIREALAHANTLVSFFSFREVTLTTARAAENRGRKFDRPERLHLLAAYLCRLVLLHCGSLALMPWKSIG